eukprot:scaffold48459_cov30-Phaeocystis_antarctica.AAC.1
MGMLAPAAAHAGLERHRRRAHLALAQRRLGPALRHALEVLLEHPLLTHLRTLLGRLRPLLRPQGGGWR